MMEASRQAHGLGVGLGFRVVWGLRLTEPIIQHSKCRSANGSTPMLDLDPLDYKFSLYGVFHLRTAG